MNLSEISAKIVILVNNKPIRIQVEEAMQSSSYGIMVHSKKLHCQIPMVDQIEIITILKWEKK